MGRKRRFTCKQAYDCEWALAPRCTCRCEGALHGSKRTHTLSSLPFADLHQPNDQGELYLGGKHASRTYGAP